MKKDYGKRRIALITLEGVLHDRSYTELRKHIYENWYIEYIIALPPFAFKPYANSNAVILYLTAIGEREQEHVWYFKVKNDGFTENKREPKEGKCDFDIFFRCKDKSEEEKLKAGFHKLDTEKIKNNNYASVPASHVKEFRFEGSKHEMVSLGKLIEKVRIPNKENFPIWSLTKNRGFIPHEKKYKEPIYSKDTSKYNIVPPKHFAYRAPGVNEGYIGYNHRETSICIPHYYPVFKVKNEQRIIPEYLFCVCQSAKFREQANAFFRGTARPGISFADFCKIKVPILPLEEQQKVISELNQIKQNIQNSQKTIDDLNCSLSLSLCFEKEIETKKLGNIATFEYGNYDGKAEDRGKYRLVRITDIDEFGEISDQDKKYVDLAKESNVNKFLSKGDIVVSRQAFPARAGIFEEEKAVLSSNLVKVKFNEEVLLPKYFLWFSQTQEWEKQVKELTKGTAQPVFSANALKDIMVPSPSLDKQKEIIQKRKKDLAIINYQKQSIKLLKEKEKRFLESIWEKN